MPEFLVIQVPAPMASWGGVAKGEVRPTDVIPRRSTLLGLVAASLGIERHEEDRQRALADSTEFAIEVRSAGRAMVDYHTVARVTPPSAHRSVVYATRADEVRRGTLNTIVSQRFYRTDACYRVAIWVSPSARWSLDELAASLMRPRFTLYLGRKSCPLVAPLCPTRIDVPSIREAFEATSGSHLKEELPLACLSTDAAEPIRLHWSDLPAGSSLFRTPGLKPETVVTKHDDPVSRPRTVFRQRQELSATIAAPEPTEQGGTDVPQ